MKKITSIILVSITALAACNNTGEGIKNDTDTAVATMQNKVNEVKDELKDNHDENFVADVIKSNSKELHLLWLATHKATRKDIKDIAKKMTVDHKKLGDDMSAYAAKNNIKADVDSSDIKSDLDDDKAGADWDKKWLNSLADAHQNTIEKFEKEEGKANNDELKTMVMNALPTLRQHYDMVKNIQDKMK